MTHDQKHTNREAWEAKMHYKWLRFQAWTFECNKQFRPEVAEKRIEASLRAYFPLEEFEVRKPPRGY